MKQCKNINCRRLVGGKLARCPYCGNPDFLDLELRKEPSSKYRITEKEIVVDDAPYKIKKYIGKGGFGRVIQVKNEREKESWALKVPFLFDEYFSNRKGGDESELEYSKNSLKKEIQAYADIKNKICSSLFLDFHRDGKMSGQEKATGKEEKFPVFLMELAEGTLKDLLEKEAAGMLMIPFQEKQVIIENIMSAVSELHKVLVHRDLSPDNFFIVDRLNIAYVLGDLGTSKRVNATVRTIPTQIEGKGCYIDPLIYLSNDKNYRQDSRIDVYSMGIIVCEILMGVFSKDFMTEDDPVAAVDFENNFLGTKARKNITKYLQKENKTGIVDELIRVLSRALTRDPSKRYQSIDEFRDKLFEVLGITGALNREMREIAFAFTVRLPFGKPEVTAVLNRIPVEKDTVEISLKDYQGAELDFVQFTPQHAEIKNTSLYLHKITGRSIYLSFRNNKFKELISGMESVDSNVSGELHFQGAIYVEGVPV